MRKLVDEWETRVSRDPTVTTTSILPCNHQSVYFNSMISFERRFTLIGIDIIIPIFIDGQMESQGS